MLKIEKFVTPSPEQWEIIIEGLRNPKNSWDRMDSFEGCCGSKRCNACYEVECCGPDASDFYIGPNDHTLMMQLADSGPVHAKYRRMIDVFVTINAPLYFWKEFDTYKIGTTCNSCSTMHKIHAKEFTMEDFSTEHLMTSHTDSFPLAGIHKGIVTSPLGIMENTITALNEVRKKFLECTVSKYAIPAEYEKAKKDYWWQMIQLLPTSYNQKRTIKLNYEVLHNIYTWRRNHKLDEWHTFCDWIEELPYSELIIGEREEKDESQK